jgi:metallo-beta-lactamase class B
MRIAITIAASMISAMVAQAQPAPAQAPAPMDKQKLVEQLTGPGSQIVEPFKIVGNVYYVGAANIASYLISTPQGLVLLDTGTLKMGPGILDNIRKLGFEPRNVKYLLSSHAHFDHIEGHAAMKRATGATVVALGADATALESGTDTSAIGADKYGWEPVKVDRVIKDGDTVTLGGTTLTAIATPGHTQGTTNWRMNVDDGGKTYSVFFYSGLGPNPWPDLIENSYYPNVVQDTLRSIRKFSAIPKPDITLVGHPQGFFAGKIERIKAGERPHPLLTTDETWKALTSGAGFFTLLEQQAHSPAVH